MIALHDLLESGSELEARTVGPVFARSFAAIAYDSRTVRPGDLFVAIRTDRADGHDYVERACAAGAAGVLVERPFELEAYGTTCVLVQDTRAALVRLATHILRRQAPDIIAVAGGVGKTSTEEAIVRVLSIGEGRDESVFWNGNLNDLFGLPVALGGLELSHTTAVLEVASDRSGEMAELVEMIQPLCAVVTNVAPIHRDSLGGIDRFVTEQQALVRAIPADGWAILNGDDELVRSLTSNCRGTSLLYGLSPGLDVRGTNVKASTEGLAITVSYAGAERRIETRLLGFHNAYTVLAACAAGLARGLSLDECGDRLAAFEALPGRLRPLAGVRGALLLDDSQSASPRSVAAALETLDLFPSRKIAVLGDIPDLDLAGEDQALAAQIAVSVDLLLTLGAHAEGLGRNAIDWGLPAERHIALSSHDDLADALQGTLSAGDTVLVKGGEEARMERVVERLLAQPEQAPQLLVRQDPGWKQRVFLARERPTWIELDLAAIANNIERVCALAGPATEVMIVLKADAYGHGAVPVARTALLHGATMGAVACLGEAVTLREAGIRAPLILLGHVPAWQSREIVRHGLSTAIYSRDLAIHLSRAATSAHAPTVPVHIKVDTGMSRLGLLPDEVPAFIDEIAQLPGITIEGIFTHFATADAGDDDAFSQTQLRRFRQLLERLRSAGREFRYVHAANSAGFVNGFGSEFNLVRIGILAYGLDPSSETPCPDGFRPALSFKTRVAQVKSLPAGACVSYGCSFITERPSSIAVLPVGYGDGFRRSPAAWGEVLIRGHRAPIVGNVCMDMAMIDVTDVPGAKEGDEVVLIGSQGDQRITADDVARRLGTINYEVVTQILPRVPRTIP